MKRILNKIAKALSAIEDVKAVVLYGSFARGEYTSRSDIDFNSKKYCLTFICIMIRCGIDARAEDKGWQKNWSIGNVPASEP